MNEKERIGAVAEHKAATYYLSKDYNVFFPTGQSPAADFIAVKGKEVIRVQVKAAHITSKKISGSSYIVSSFHKYPTDEEFDELVILFEDMIWVFPVNVVSHMRTVTLAKLQEINRSPDKNFKAEPYRVQ